MLSPADQLDTFGFLHLHDALSPDELASARAAASRYIAAARSAPETLAEPFGQGGNATTPWCGDDPRRFPFGFAFDKALERLCFHPALWPIVLELTGGQPQLTMGTLQADGYHEDGALIHTDGLSLHRAADDGWDGVPFPSPDHVSRRLTQVGGARAFPFDTVCPPLSYSGNPGVDVESYWETPAVEELRCTDFVFFPYLDDVGPADGGL
jgi:hypothetical protein